MAFTPITLKKTTTFYRANSEATLVMNPGEVVHYQRAEDETHVIHTARTRRDGYEWTSVETRAKHPETTKIDATTAAGQSAIVNAPMPAVVAVPSVTQVNNAMMTTAKSAHAAITTIASRSERAVDKNENHVRTLARASEMLRGDVYQVNYYIPSDLNDEVDNPSRIFRRHGFRLDGSNWVFPAHGLENPAVQKVLKGWDDMAPVAKDSSLPGFASTVRVRYWVIKYTTEQLNQMKELAQSQLAEELQKTHRSLLQRIDSASNDLAAANNALPPDAGDSERDALENWYNARMRASVKEACERFEMCLKGAEIFDDTGDLDALFGAVRDAIRTQAESANAMLAAKHVKTVAVPVSIAPTTPNSVGTRTQRV